MQIHERDQGSQKEHKVHPRRKKIREKSTRQVEPLGTKRKKRTSESKNSKHKRLIVRPAKPEVLPDDSPHEPQDGHRDKAHITDHTSETSERHNPPVTVSQTDHVRAPTHPDVIPEIVSYQASRPERTDTSEETFREISGQIAANDKLRRTIMANPFSERSKSAIADQFPQTPHADVVRAAILAEPISAADEPLLRASKAEKTDIRSRQIDESAEMAVRLIKFVTDDRTGLNLKERASDDNSIIYKRLCETAFGTADQQEIEQQLPRDIRRSFRMAIFNFTADLPVIRHHQKEFDEAPKRKAAELLGKKINGPVHTDRSPWGHIIYVDETDYSSLSLINDTTLETLGSIDGNVVIDKPTDDFPQELLGRVAVINGSNRWSKDGKETADHEARHMLFDRFFSRIAFRIRPWESWDPTETLPEQRANSQEICTVNTEIAKNEVFAYFRLHPNNLGMFHMGVTMYQSDLDQTRTRLWKQEDMEPADKTARYDIYDRGFATHLDEVRTFHWVSDKLYEEAQKRRGKRGDKGLTMEKAEALLLITDPKNARWLAPYFGARPEDIPQMMRVDEQKQVQEFSTAVDTLANPPEVQYESDYKEALEDYKNILGKLSFSLPKAALPDLLKGVTHIYDKRAKNTSIAVIRLMLDAHHRDMTAEELASVKNSLGYMMKKSDYDEYPDAVYEAASLMCDIDQVYRPGGVNFKQKPFQSEYDDLMETPDEQEPTREQISGLVHLLAGKEPHVWYAYFAGSADKYCDILGEQPDGIEDLIEIGKSGDRYIVNRALEKLEELADERGYLTLDVIPQFDEMLTKVLGMSGRAQEIKATDFDNWRIAQSIELKLKMFELSAQMSPIKVDMDGEKKLV